MEKAGTRADHSAAPVQNSQNGYRNDRILLEFAQPASADPRSAGEDSGKELSQIWQNAQKSGDWDPAIQFFERFLRQNPTHLQAATFRVSAYLGTEKLKYALAAAQEAMVHHPDDPSLLYLVGEIHYRQNRLVESLRYWERSLASRESADLRALMEKARRDLSTERTYDQISGVRFRMAFQGDGGSDALAREVLAHLERSIDELSIRLDHFPPSTITIILYPDQEFRDTTLSSHDVQGLFDGKIRVPVGGLTRVSENLQRVLDHELAHAIIDSKTGSNCPAWLHEGLAQFVSGDTSQSRRRNLAGEYSRLRDTGGWHPGISYPAALSCVEYLSDQYGFFSWLTILAHMGNGEPFSRALATTLRIGSDELFTQWGDSLQTDPNR
ncbi:MAG: hypothetical protein V3T54_07485 [Acidobacteriota bacterium]